MNNEIKNIIEISQYYGKSKEYVIAGGGNTSYKDDEKIWVKASGHALATITEEGFAVLDRAKLEVISEKQYSTDSFERERQIKDDLTEACITKDRRPSVETSLHNLISYNYVVHLHPTLVNGLMCANDAARKTLELFGKEALFIPYIDPGYILYKEVEAKVIEYKESYGCDPKMIFLQNHGVFVSANDTNEIKTIYEKIFSILDTKITPKMEEIPLAVPTDIKEILPAIRMVAGSE
ncbi:MAG: class II aldolase/adducin family protein, partial [Bacteroidales bacterium]|nr:class II aldolase/adducin family protein [Bacteroidales bacterium]